MSSRERKQPRKERNLTGWFLGGIIVVLAVLDLYVWAALWNAPNPVSEMLGTTAAHAASVHHAGTQGSPFR